MESRLKINLLLEESSQYEISLIENKLVFYWKRNIPSFSESDYQNALKRIAFHCIEQRPLTLLIDKRAFAPNIQFDRNWWSKNILPAYLKSGIRGLGHITKKVKKARLLTPTENVAIKMMEFPSLEEALNWTPGN